MAEKSTTKSTWKSFLKDSMDLDPVQCYKSTPAKYLQKFGLIENGKYDCNGDGTKISKQLVQNQQNRKFDHSLFIDYDQCLKSAKCQDLINSITFTSYQHLMTILKENDCVSCLNSSLLQM